MVRYLQEALVQRGYDVGGVDGAMGPRTRAAIVAFQADLGLEQTGIADEALLARLSIDTIPAPRTQPVQVSPATAPAPAPRAAVKAPSEMDRALSMAGDSSGQGRLVRTQPVRIDDLIAGAAPGGADPSLAPVPPAPVGDPLVAQVQGVLANLGYAPGRIDGFLGESTQGAIARFRADRGLPPGNTVTPDLLSEIATVTGVQLTR